MKKILLLIIFLVILVAIPLTVYLAKVSQDTRQRAAPNTRVYISPDSISTSVGQTFDADVTVDPGTNLLSAVSLDITFDHTILEVQSINVGSSFPVILESPTYDNDTGIIHLEVGTSPSTPIQAVASVAKITFTALANTTQPSLIQFADSSGAAASGSEDLNTNVIQSKSSGSVTVSDSTTSPSPSTSPSGDPSTSPSTGPSASPSSGPSSTPTTSPSPSASSNKVTVILTPSNGAVLSTKRPTFTGKTFPNAQVLINISMSPPATELVYANASGNWSFTPAYDIQNGTYNFSISVDNPNSPTPETDSISFTINVSSAQATPSSVAQASSTPVASTTSGGTGGGSGTSKGGTEDVPVTATSTPTLILLGLSFIFFLSGAIFLVSEKK